MSLCFHLWVGETGSSRAVCDRCGIYSHLTDFYTQPATQMQHFYDLLNARWDQRLRSDYRDFAIPFAGLAEEAGEVLGRYKKHIRDGVALDHQETLLELGDVFHYWCRCVYLAGFTPMQVLHANQEKLAKRVAERGQP